MIPKTTALWLWCWFFVRASALQSQEDVRPPIFAPTASTTSVNPGGQSTSFIAEATRQRVNEAVFSRASPSTLTAIDHDLARTVTQDTVQMAPYVVGVTKAPDLVTPKPEHVAVRFLKTGTLLYSPGKHFDTRLSFPCLDFGNPTRNAQQCGVYPVRATIEFSFLSALHGTVAKGGRIPTVQSCGVLARRSPLATAPGRHQPTPCGSMATNPGRTPPTAGAPLMPPNSIAPHHCGLRMSPTTCAIMRDWSKRRNVVAPAARAASLRSTLDM